MNHQATMPKYWLPEQQRVVHGVEMASQAISPASLCGTYVFVWEDDQHGEEFGPGVGGMTIACTGAPTPANISGTVSFFDVRGPFRGLSARHYNSGAVMPNSWALRRSKLTDDDTRSGAADDSEDHAEDDAEDDAEDEHWITALEVRDDRGQPFVEFVYEAGWSGCAPQYLAWIAKKQADDAPPEGLSAAERRRLGMGLGFEELQDMTKREPLAAPDPVVVIKRKADEEAGEKLPKAPKLDDA